MQDDRGPEIAPAIVEFLDRTVTATPGGERRELAQERDARLIAAAGSGEGLRQTGTRA